MNNNTGRLTERQRRFADLYLQLGNASEAAERAGFSRSYAQAAKRQPAVRAYMDSRLKEIQNKDVATADEVLKYLTDVMRGAHGQENTLALSSRRAAEMLARRFGLERRPGSGAAAQETAAGEA